MSENAALHVGVVINPQRADDEIVDRLEQAGCRVSARTPDTPDDLAAAVDQLVADGAAVIAAVGGDGTQRTAAAALVDTDVALAVVPGGTVNLLAHVLGTPDTSGLVAAVRAGHTRRIDLGQIDGNVFVLNASTGWDASVIGRVDDRHKRFGRVGFAAAAVVAWRRSSTTHVTVEADGEAWFDGQAHTVLVMNVGHRATADFELAADARLDDGRLDILVFRRHSALGLGRSIWAALRGRELPRRDVAVTQAADARVMWAQPVDVQLDGDPLPAATTTTYTSLPSALRVVTAHS